MHNIDHLLSLLGEERDVLTHLLDLVREERSCLLLNHVERLEAVIEEQMSLLAVQRHSSLRITQELAELSSALDIDGSPSLGCVIEHLPSSQADVLRSRHEELTALAAELQREGRITWHMAQQAMNYIDFALKLIGRSCLGAMPYSPHKKSSAPASVQVLINNCA